jgi:hypothetical protein
MFNSHNGGSDSARILISLPRHPQSAFDQAVVAEPIIRRTPKERLLSARSMFLYHLDGFTQPKTKNDAPRTEVLAVHGVLEVFGEARDRWAPLDVSG